MKKGHCIFFCGIQHEKCDAGLDMRAITGGGVIGWAKRMPCFKENNSGTECSRYLDPTEEQIKEDEAWINAAVRRIREACPLISEIKREYKGRSGVGIKTCPICNGAFHFRIAECNGHIHGKCETKDCLSFIE